MKHNEYLKDALKTGLSAKGAAVYVAALRAGSPLSPKSLILQSGLHRQYVYDALRELENRGLMVRVGIGRKVKYQPTSPDRLLQDAEKQRLDAFSGVRSLMKLYDCSPAGLVEIIRGSEACIESEFEMLKQANKGDCLDIVGGGGMRFVDIFQGRIEEWEALRAEKDISLRYIGCSEDVEHNRTVSPITNESRIIEGIGDIVNVCIRPDSVSFNIYEPEILTVRVRSKEAVISQRALFEVLWGVAK